jgi:hypothetical protein
MFEPEIFGLASPALWSLTQALVTPTLGFLFLYLMRLPLPEFSFLPRKTEYTPPAWVLPIFAHGSIFALVAIVSTNVILNNVHARALADDVKSDLFLVRDVYTDGKRLTKVAIVLKSYDGLSGFKIFANGYHIFSSDRNCVAAFQCTQIADKAEREMEEFKRRRVSGGSLYELNKTNTFPLEIPLNNYLAVGQNYLEVISENSGTGGCGLSAEIVLTTEQNQHERYLLKILPHPASPERKQPNRRSDLISEEEFYTGGPISGETIERDKTPTPDKRNVVCERIRIPVKLTEEQGQKLSTEAEFESHFRSRQKAYVCETIGKPLSDCGPRP